MIQPRRGPKILSLSYDGGLQIELPTETRSLSLVAGVRTRGIATVVHGGAVSLGNKF